jgi:hypothetical protein
MDFDQAHRDAVEARRRGMAERRAADARLRREIRDAFNRRGDGANADGRRPPKAPGAVEPRRGPR